MPHAAPRQRCPMRIFEANPGEEDESDFQSYHTVRFKCSVLNKITRRVRKKENMAHSKENRSKENTCEEDQMAAYQKDFKMTVLKIIKELKNDIDKFKKLM